MNHHKNALKTVQTGVIDNKHITLKFLDYCKTITEISINIHCKICVQCYNLIDEHKSTNTQMCASSYINLRSEMGTIIYYVVSVVFGLLYYRLDNKFCTILQYRSIG